MRELALVHLGGGMQVPHQKRQPAVPLRQHRDDQLDERAPALIAHGEHALHGLPKLSPRSCSSARRAASSYSGLALSMSVSRPPAPEMMGNCAASQALNESMVSMRSREGWRPRSMPRSRRWRRAATASSQVCRLRARRALRQAAGLEGTDHAGAHLLGGAAGEGQRKNALRRIDRREQPQVALR